MFDANTVVSVLARLMRLIPSKFGARWRVHNILVITEKFGSVGVSNYKK